MSSMPALGPEAANNAVVSVGMLLDHGTIYIARQGSNNKLFCLFSLLFDMITNNLNIKI